MMRPIVFDADYPKATWAYANLNLMAKRDFPPYGPNPLLDPARCDAWQRDISRQLGVDFNHGGHDEKRDHIWRGYYHDKKVMRHRGVDYNVPAGTRVAAPAACEVVCVYRDPDQKGGWGGYLALKLESAYNGADYLVLGHLAHDGLPRVGDFFGRGELVARLGKAEENGGWFPHLHVQCVVARVYEPMAATPYLIDGYGPNAVSVARDFPDPTLLMAGLH